MDLSFIIAMWQACTKPRWQIISGPVTQINSKILFINTNEKLEKIKADPVRR